MAKIINELQDLRYLKWSKIRHSSGTAGSFLKSCEDIGNTKKYYKLSDYDSYKGIIGHECINELIVDRLLSEYDIPHLSYELIHALVKIDDRDYETYLCGSYDFKEPGDSKIALDIFYQLEKFPNESPLDFCTRYGWDKYIWQMLFVDYLILNRDRHGANIEILRNRNSKRIAPAPLFDHGLSLAFSAHSDNELSTFNGLEDKKVQCFVGSNSTHNNLNLIPTDHMIPIKDMNQHFRDRLFDGMDSIVSKTFKSTICNMLQERGAEYERLRLKR